MQSSQNGPLYVKPSVLKAQLRRCHRTTEQRRRRRRFLRAQTGLVKKID